MRTVAILAAVMFMLAACGGGGGGGKPASMTQQPQQPQQPTQPVDTDGDGVADVDDTFPNDATETADSDGDGVGDNADAFPQDASRTEEVGRLPFPFAYVDDGDPNDETLFTRHYSIRSLTAVPSTDVRNAPVYTDEILTGEAGPTPFGQGGYRSKFFVGVDQGDISALPVTGSRGDSEIRFGQLNDGTGRSQLVAYLREVFPDAKVGRWPEAPVVRIQGQSNSLDERIVVATVQLINAALPEGYKITMGGRLPENAGATANTIRVKFVPTSPKGAGATTYNRTSTGADGSKVVTDSLIEFYKNTNVYRDATGATDAGVASVRRSVTLLAHEMMHALGLNNHPAANYPTILEGTADIYALEQNGQKQPLSLLYPADREALRALYSLEPGNDPLSLGPWASTSRHIHGNGPHTGFGVALRNGYAEPWAYGYQPDTHLADNRGLSGTAAWTGELLGLTPDAAAVAGDARIGVNLASMTGRADFTGLETWGANTAPGAEGTGTTWGDGSLGYSIVVRGNTFRETGGDDGRLTGIFTGTAHEGAAGTLERDDLTAAFGVSR